jgi:class 3 adenylate cyclase/tetratricopeptide (TPR) repeat protein
MNPAEARLCWSCGRAMAGQERGGDERRMVTVLFVDLVHFTGIAERLDPEDLKGVQAPYFQRVRAELQRYGGHVEKYIGDAVMALFGAPVAHGDDATRAVLAAFGIQRALAELNEAHPEFDLKVRIGVNTGEAFVDLAARPELGEGTATGDVVVTAFRLQAGAPVGGIVVGEATYRASQRSIGYREIEPIAAKGKEEPVRAWEAVAVEDAAGRPAAPLVGRNSELSYLSSLAFADAGQGLLLVTLLGAAGIGQTRLLGELRELVTGDTSGIIWRQGRCLSYGTGVSFSAFGELVKQHAGILESDPAEIVERKVGSAVAALVDDTTTRHWIEAYLRPLVGLEGAERLSGDRRGEAFSAWRRFIEGLAANGRVVLVFEDLHWADDGLLDFLEHLHLWARDIPVTIVSTARPELGERRPGWSSLLELEPLSSDETGELVEALLGTTLLRSERREELLARAAGNPLYAEEFVRMLQERPDDEELPLPETVQAIIAGRLDTLHPEAKEVLRDAAVVGTGFWVGALAHVSGLHPEQVERRLGELQWKELVRPRPRSRVADESQYAFWHVLIRDVAYAQIPRAARAEKHRAAAAWIESLAPGRADLTELLAHHYTRALEYAQLSHQDTADLKERARTALRDAGERALSVYAYPAAAGFFRAAIELWPAGDRMRPQLVFDLGRSLFWSERGGDAELAQARDELVAGGDLRRAAHADVLLSRLAHDRGDPEVAALRATDAVELLHSSEPSREQAEAVGHLASVYAVSGEPGRALETSAKALALAESLALDEIRAESLISRGLARIRGGDVDGIADLELAVEIADAASSPALVRSCANLATSLVELGALERAWPVYELGRAAAARFGDARGVHWLAVERPYELYWRGAWEEALAAAGSAMAEPDSGYGEHSARSVRAWIRLARGDHAGALEDSVWALDFARRAEDVPALCQGLALRARVLAEAGNMDEAAAIADDAISAAGAPDTLTSFWVADLAEALRELGRAEELVRPAPGSRTPTRWLVAARHVVAGEYLQAAEEYAVIGARPEEARARLRASTALASAGDRSAAEAELERARSFYADVEAGAYVRAAESLVAART